MASSPTTSENVTNEMWGDVQSSYAKGAPRPYSGKLYMGLGDTTKGALDGLKAASYKNTGGLDIAYDKNRDLMQAGGLLGTQRDSIADMGQIGDRYGEMYERGGAGNPYVQGMADQTADKTYSDVMASFGGQGGVGSNIQTDQLTSSLANARNGLLYQDFNDSFARQGSALSGMSGAAGQRFGMEQTGIQNTQAAAAAAPGLYQAGLMPEQVRLGVGQIEDQNAQAERLAEADLYNRQQGYEFDWLGKHAGLVSGMPAQERQPGLLDYLMTAAGTAARFI